MGVVSPADSRGLDRTGFAGGVVLESGTMGQNSGSMGHGCAFHRVLRLGNVLLRILFRPCRPGFGNHGHRRYLPGSWPIQTSLRFGPPVGVPEGMGMSTSRVQARFDGRFFHRLANPLPRDVEEGELSVVSRPHGNHVTQEGGKVGGDGDLPPPGVGI